MKSIVKTINGAFVQTCLYTGIPFQVIPHTTLNEKLGILPDIKPISCPQLKYFCVGIGGHTVGVANDIPKLEPVQHVATDCSPYHLIPLVVREPNNDLSPTQRARYCLRKEISVNNNSYIAYYAKRLDYSAAKISTNLLQTVDGTTTVTPYIPDSSNLNPKPRPTAPEGVNILEAEHIEVSTNVSIVFDEKDTEELRNVGNILFSDPQLASISELGLVSGVDKEISINDVNGGTFTFTEVVAAQCCHLNTTYHNPIIDDAGFSIDISLGTTEPLYVLKPSEK